jgi:hypothetical protein
MCVVSFRVALTPTKLCWKKETQEQEQEQEQGRTCHNIRMDMAWV